MSQFNAPPYKIDRPTGVCGMTGRTFQPEEPYVATLVEDGDSLKRVDVAMEAWEAGNQPDPLFSYWKTRVPAPNEKQKLFVDDEVLMNLFRRLEGEEQPQRIAFRFVLALILLRKRLLRYDGVEREDAGERTWWVLTPKADVNKGPLSKWDESERLKVLDPQMDEGQIRDVTEQLSEILQAEL